MKKVTKILISILLLVSIVCSFVSCSAINNVIGKLVAVDGPGCGLANYEYDVYWVETYDEMLDILSKMKAAGTDTPKIPAFNCDEHGIDVKFRISVHETDTKK